MTPFTIGYPKNIHCLLIAVLVDLQSIVIYDNNGLALGWIHEHTKKIDFAKGFDVKLNILLKESDLASQLTDYTVSYFEINGNSANRQWHVKTKFIYPHLPARPITIDTEDQY